MSLAFCFAVTVHDEPEPKTFNFKMKPSHIDALKGAQIRFVSLANNHILDYGVKGMEETISTLQSADIAHAGAGNSTEAHLPAFVTVNGVRVGFLSYSDHYKEWAAKSTSPGINFIDPLSFKEDTIASHVRLARQSADVVVVFIHWGPNWRWKPSSSIRKLGRAFIDAGVDVVFGHSSHHVQGIEVYNECPIIYGAGGFIDDYALDEDYRNDLGFVYEVVFEKNTNEQQPFRESTNRQKCYRVDEIELLPIKIEHTWRTFQERQELPGPPYLSTVHLAGGRDASWLQKTMESLCMDMGTTVNRSGTTSESLRVPLCSGASSGC